MKRWIAFALVGPCLAALILGAQLYYFAITPFREEQKPSEHIFLLRKGESTQAFSHELEANGVISSELEFHLLGRILRKWGHIKAGEYLITPSMSPIEIFSTLTNGLSIIHPVTVREGENMYEIAEDLEKKGLAKADAMLALMKSPEIIKSFGFTDPLPSSLEGFLYPETYNFNRTESPQELLKTMVKKFQAQWGKAEQDRAKELGMTRYEVITLASMIEKETGAPWERPKISSVFHNRLAKKMRLQSDPTTIYGMWERYEGKITKADLQAPTPYNTYTIPALPIGPISNPGKEAIQAALHPETTDAFFFVSQNDGTHIFSKNYEDHTKAVRKFQLDPNAREGKSWRDLSKKLGTDKSADHSNKNTNESTKTSQ